jgi:RhoGEF domain/PH domain
MDTVSTEATHDTGDDDLAAQSSLKELFPSPHDNESTLRAKLESAIRVLQSIQDSSPQAVSEALSGIEHMHTLSRLSMPYTVSGNRQAAACVNTQKSDYKQENGTYTSSSHYSHSYAEVLELVQNGLRGQLRKRGQWNPAFKSRYFHVSKAANGDFTLAYYVNETDTQPRGSIALREAKIVVADEDISDDPNAHTSTRCFEFQIVPKSPSRAFTLRASSIEQLKHWVSSLRKVIAAMLDNAHLQKFQQWSERNPRAPRFSSAAAIRSRKRRTFSDNVDRIVAGFAASEDSHGADTIGSSVAPLTVRAISAVPPTKPMHRKLGSDLLDAFADRKCLLIRLQARVRGFIIRRRFRKIVYMFSKSKFAKHLRQRARVLAEIESSEKRYVHQLETLIKHFQQPMLEHLSPAIVDSIFINVNLIYALHHGFLAAVETCMLKWPHQTNMMQAFVSLIPKLQLYAEYIARYETAINTLDTVAESHGSILENLFAAEPSVLVRAGTDRPQPIAKATVVPPLSSSSSAHSLTSNTNTNTNNNNNNNKNSAISTVIISRSASSKANWKNRLVDLLIVPVQRVPRYILLLRELLKNTLHDNSEYSSIETTLFAMKQMADHINEYKRVVERKQRIQEVSDSLKGPKTMLMPVLRSGWLWKRSKHTKEWRRRFAIIEGEMLQFFHRVEFDMNVKGVYNLRLCKVHLLRDDASKDNVRNRMMLSFSKDNGIKNSDASLYLSTDSSIEVLDWIQSIRIASSLTQRGLYSSLAVSHRSLLKEGRLGIVHKGARTANNTISAQSGDAFRCFLCNDLLLYTTENKSGGYDYAGVIHTPTIQMVHDRMTFSTASAEHKHGHSCDDTFFVMSGDYYHIIIAPSAHEKREWMMLLQQASEQYVYTDYEEEDQARIRKELELVQGLFARQRQDRDHLQNDISSRQRDVFHLDGLIIDATSRLSDAESKSSGADESLVSEDIVSTCRQQIESAVAQKAELESEIEEMMIQLTLLNNALTDTRLRRDEAEMMSQGLASK